jgi:hypothetical protein
MIIEPAGDDNARIEKMQTLPLSGWFCVRCDKNARYMYDGSSFCKECLKKEKNK